MAEKAPMPKWMRPLWVRLALVVLPAGWAAFEVLRGDQTWGLLFGATAAWGLWSLVIKYDEQDPRA